MFHYLCSVGSLCTADTLVDSGTVCSVKEVNSCRWS